MSLSTSATALRVVHASACPDLGPVCGERDEPPQLHDQRFAIGELRLTAEHALSDAWGVEAQLPVRLHHTRIQFRALDGTPRALDYVNIHHRDETLAGVGDAWLQARFAHAWGATSLAARAGTTLPLGRTVEDPFALGAAGLEHQHVQFGAGVPQPLLGLELARRVGEVHVRAHGQAQLGPWENRHGFRAGSRVSAGLEASGRVWRELRASAGADVVAEGAERWAGEVQEDGNVGRTDLLVGAGLSLPVGGWDVGLRARVRVASWLLHHDGQLEYPGVLALTLGRTFGAAR